eukprot:23361_4
MNGIFFTFFTHWTFILLTTYFTVASYITWSYHLKGTSYIATSKLLNGKYRRLAFWAFFEVVSAATFGLDVIYWMSVFNGSGNNWTNVHVHAINALYILVEIYYNQLKFNKHHLIFLLTYNVVYLVF